MQYEYIYLFWWGEVSVNMIAWEQWCNVISVVVVDYVSVVTVACFGGVG